MNDPFELDREIAKTAALLRKERARFRTLDGAKEGPQPIARRVSSKATLDEICELEARGGSPLARALSPWLRYLSVARVTGDERAALAASRFSEHGSFSDVVRAMLSSGANLPVIEGTACEAADGMRDALRRHEERVREASRLIEHPRDIASSSALGEAVLALTEPLFARDACSRWSQRFPAALASDAAEGWPVHLSPRWLASLFDRGELLRGVKLENVQLPSPLGAASFARALGILGEMLAFADVPSGTPFALVRTPADSLVARRKALFAGLVLEPAFFHKKLGLSRSAALEQARRVARAAVVWLRVQALAVLARDLLLAPQGPRDFADLSERALGRALPPALLGVLPRLCDGDGLALASAADACAGRDSLRQRFDEDWFENPRAHEELRHEHHLPVADRPRLWPTTPGDGLDTQAAEAAQLNARIRALTARLDEALHE